MYWLGIDVGTGGTRALLVDEAGTVRAGLHRAARRHAMERPLWAEQRPGELVGAAVAADPRRAGEAGVAGAQVNGIGLSGQMHGLVILDDGERGDPPVADLVRSAQPGAGGFRQREGRAARTCCEYTANPVLTGFTLPKLLWVRDNEPRNFERVRQDAAAQGLRALPADRRVRHRSLRRLRHGAVRRGEPALVATR